MCCMFGFRASEPTRVDCRLVASQNALLATAGQADSEVCGWGVVCYGNLSEGAPLLVRHQTAGHHPAEFSLTARALPVRTLLAHVRMESLGYVGSLNSQPFTHDAWSFAHFGRIEGFDRLRASLMMECGHMANCRTGTSESELFFLWLLRRLELDGVELNSPRLARAMISIESAVHDLDARCRSLASTDSMQLTFMLTNGANMIACRWGTPLHLAVENEVVICPVCRASHVASRTDGGYRCIFIASDSVGDRDWQTVPEHSLLAVDEQLRVMMESPFGACCRDRIVALDDTKFEITQW